MQRLHEIKVGPCGDGWSVECSGAFEPIMFLSGGRAEQHAKLMVAASTKAGIDVQLLVCDRAGVVLAATRFFGDLSEAWRLVA